MFRGHPMNYFLVFRSSGTFHSHSGDKKCERMGVMTKRSIDLDVKKVFDTSTKTPEYWQENIPDYKWAAMSLYKSNLNLPSSAIFSQSIVTFLSYHECANIGIETYSSMPFAFKLPVMEFLGTCKSLDMVTFTGKWYFWLVFGSWSLLFIEHIHPRSDLCAWHQQPSSIFKDGIGVRK